jgi:hypothetical protein
VHDAHSFPRGHLPRNLNSEAETHVSESLYWKGVAPHVVGQQSVFFFSNGVHRFPQTEPRFAG